MRRLVEISLFAAAVLSSIYAQEAAPQTPLPQPIRNAIDRLIQGGAAQPRITVFEGGYPAEICSVPLLEMHVQNPQAFALRTIPPPATGDQMPVAQAPAPPCKPTASSAPTGPRP
jgi:hypothetical protein